MYKNAKQNKYLHEYKDIYDVKKIFSDLEKEIEIILNKMLLLYVKNNEKCTNNCN